MIPNLLDCEIDNSYLIYTIDNGFTTIFRFGKENKLNNNENFVDSIHGFGFGSIVWGRPSIHSHSLFPGKVSFFFKFFFVDN